VVPQYAVDMTGSPRGYQYAAESRPKRWRVSRAPDTKMRSVPNKAWGSSSRASVSCVPREIAKRFDHLYDRWDEDTAPLSSITQIVLHPAYQQIIGLGRLVIPLVFQKLLQEPVHWSWALSAITGESPVADEDAGNADRTRDAWLRVAREKGWSWGSAASEVLPTTRQRHVGDHKREGE